MIRPRTFRGPRARVARATQTAESSPPESPRMPFLQPPLPSSSRMKRTRTFSTNGALIFGGTGGPFEGSQDDLGLLVPFEKPFFPGLPDGGEVDPADEKLRGEVGGPGDDAH